MKSGEGSYRQSRAPKTVRPMIRPEHEERAMDHKAPELSTRTQRRLLESEERRAKRKARRDSKRRGPEDAPG
jgi:hypothetical protein